MWHALAHWFGLDNGSGGQYLFWSGIFGDVTIFAAAVGLWWHHTCHVTRCWRPGLHRVDGTPYVTCKTHHPTIDQRQRVTGAAVHEEHQRVHRGW